jgi:hypothetical protein
MAGKMPPNTPMQRATKAISLVLIGTATALLGYEAVAPSHPTDDSGADFDTYSSTTQPSGSRYSGSRYHHYHSGYSNFFFGRSGGGYGSTSYSSYSSSRGGSSSSHASGTARGGFGASGHAAGHASGS